MDIIRQLHQVVSGFGPVFASFPNLNLTVAVLVRGPEGSSYWSKVVMKSPINKRFIINNI